MKRVVLAVLALAILVVSLWQIQPFLICRSKLRNALLNNLTQYRFDHNGDWPKDIYTIAASFPGGDRVETDPNLLASRLSCPGVRKHDSMATNDATPTSDYDYVNWQPFSGTNSLPDNVPMFYDRRLSNHWGLGVNVLTTSGVFWDFRAHWLKKFAAQHPDYHIPLPE